MSGQQAEQIYRNLSFLKHKTIVAIENDEIVGFGDIDASGYLDRLFVHKDYQRMGVASAICNELEDTVKGRTVTTHASITEKPFFQQQGYRVVKEQKVIRQGIALKNYVMEKQTTFSLIDQKMEEDLS